ncbi:MAG: M20 family metallo-hydrolase [Bacteroidales bacterium]|nr:M20 family metallo-hydrolase [Bacteroidales bacterium]
MEQQLVSTDPENIYQEAVGLLKELITTPSYSREEQKTAQLIAGFLIKKHIPFCQKGNNIWAYSKGFDSSKPVVLLNSHHDTVKPNKHYSRDPFSAVEQDGKLYGLGSNDAGASLVSLLSTFVAFYDKADLPFSLIMAATAEEENSGENGIELILPELGKIDLAIVGEPTTMQMAIAERGLLVLDCLAKGTAAHAAHPGSDNAILHAMDDIRKISSFSFPKKSEMLGEVKLTVSIIQGGILHNMVPDTCAFTIDVRINDCYRNAEVVDSLRNLLSSEISPRSLKLNASAISTSHPVVKTAHKLGIKTYASPTTSDMAVIPYPSVKIGPGSSLRSHTADEFIFLNEIKEGITGYIQLLNQLKFT